MRQVVKRISLTQPAPIQIDSTEPEVIEAALEQIPGRAIVNSVNLEAGRDKLDRVAPLAKAHGAGLIALTIDEVGMAKTAERKLEVARRITELCCDEHGLDPESLIFDCLTFTLTTGDEEWRPSRGRDDRGDPPDQGGDPGGQDLARRLERLVRSRPAGPQRHQQRVPAPLRRCRARPRDGQSEPHHAVRRDPGHRARTRRRPRPQPPRGRARAVDRPLRGEGATAAEAAARDRRPDRGDGARGGAALPHPASAQGGRRGRGSTAASRRSAPSRRSTRCCCRR